MSELLKTLEAQKEDIAHSIVSVEAKLKPLEEEKKNLKKRLKTINKVIETFKNLFPDS